MQPSELMAAKRTLPPRKGSLAAKKCRQQLIIFLQKNYVINQQEISCKKQERFKNIVKRNAITIVLFYR